MKIDYSKLIFTPDEYSSMRNETSILESKNPNHVPMLIQLKSKILKMDKHKFLVSDDILFSDFINNTLKKKIINLHENDTINIHIVKLNQTDTFPYNYNNELIDVQTTAISMKDLYNEHKDEYTNLLILRISRNTTFKNLKKYMKNMIGYS